jgi:hypothetical protein
MKLGWEITREQIACASTQAGNLLTGSDITISKLKFCYYSQCLADILTGDVSGG